MPYLWARMTSNILFTGTGLDAVINDCSMDTKPSSDDIVITDIPGDIMLVTTAYHRYSIVFKRL